MVRNIESGELPRELPVPVSDAKPRVVMFGDASLLPVARCVRRSGATLSACSMMDTARGSEEPFVFWLFFILTLRLRGAKYAIHLRQLLATPRGSSAQSAISSVAKVRTTDDARPRHPPSLMLLPYVSHASERVVVNNDRLRTTCRCLWLAAERVSR